jgi:hypothetical protein
VLVGFGEIRRIDAIPPFEAWAAPKQLQGDV